MFLSGVVKNWGMFLFRITVSVQSCLASKAYRHCIGPIILSGTQWQAEHECGGVLAHALKMVCRIICRVGTSMG